MCLMVNLLLFVPFRIICIQGVSLSGKYEYQSRGYAYDTAIGMPNKGIPAGTPWEQLRYGVHNTVRKKYFAAETEEISGFKENLKFGLGGNSLISRQKSSLILGGLFIGFLVLMSGYLLE